MPLAVSEVAACHPWAGHAKRSPFGATVDPVVSSHRSRLDTGAVRGAHGAPTPNLTIGDIGTRVEHERAAEAVASALAIGAHSSAIHLCAGSHAPYSWTEHAVIELGSDSPTRSDNKSRTRQTGALLRGAARVGPHAIPVTTIG